MTITVDSRKPAEIAVDLLALPFVRFHPSKWRLSPRVAALDRALDGAIATALGSGDFRGKADESLLLFASFRRRFVGGPACQ